MIVFVKTKMHSCSTDNHREWNKANKVIPVLPFTLTLHHSFMENVGVFLYSKIELYTLYLPAGRWKEVDFFTTTKFTPSWPYSITASLNIWTLAGSESKQKRKSAYTSSNQKRCFHQPVYRLRSLKDRGGLRFKSRHIYVLHFRRISHVLRRELVSVFLWMFLREQVKSRCYIAHLK